jgi:hypothetical protein
MFIPPFKDAPRRTRYLYNEMVRNFNEYEQFERRFPYEGGTRDQPVRWKRMITCALIAQTFARGELEQIEEEQRNNDVGGSQLTFSGRPDIETIQSQAATGGYQPDLSSFGL